MSRVLRGTFAAKERKPNDRSDLLGLGGDGIEDHRRVNELSNARDSFEVRLKINL